MSVCHQVHATESQTRSWFWFSAYIHEPPTTCCWGKEEEDHSCWAWCPNKAMKFQSNAFESQHISSIYPVSFVYAVCKWTTVVSTAITRFSCRRDAGRWVAVKSARWTAGSQVGVCDRTLSDPKEWTFSFAVAHQICEPTHQRLSHFNKGSEGGNVNVFIRCRQTYDHLEQWPEGHLWPATHPFVTPKLLSFITCFAYANVSPSCQHKWLLQRMKKMYFVQFWSSFHVDTSPAVRAETEWKMSCSKFTAGAPCSSVLSRCSTAARLALSPRNKLSEQPRRFCMLSKRILADESHPPAEFCELRESPTLPKYNLLNHSSNTLEAIELHYIFFLLKWWFWLLWKTPCCSDTTAVARHPTSAAREWASGRKGSRG